jgi:predicted GNAT superfamily acetyltransferase
MLTPVRDPETAATEAAARAGVAVRELTSAAEAGEAARLHAAIWRVPPEAAPVGKDTLRALAGTGNYVAGAYAGDRMVGAAVAFLAGPRPLELHSHVTGIVDGTQGRGVGFALKLHQRAWALARDIGTVTWTTDPLLRRNVYFNLAKLGAEVRAYLPDHYGPMDDGVNAGDESDRLALSWPLASARVAAACAGTPYAVSTAGAAPLLRAGPDGAPVLDPAAGGPALRCAVPADAVALRAADPAAALAWRRALREALGGALAAGYRVAGFTRDGEYLLVHEEER